METVSILDAKDQLAELASDVEAGETIVVTRNGKPAFEMTPCRKRGGINFEAGYAYLASKGLLDRPFFIADDFEDPLPEDFLIRPLPSER